MDLRELILTMHQDENLTAEEIAEALCQDPDYVNEVVNQG